jgi:hypothetical protein
MDKTALSVKSGGLYYPLIALGLAFLFYLHIHASSFSFLDHRFHPSICFLLIAGAVFWAGLTGIQIFFVRWERSRYRIPPDHARKRHDLILLPLVLSLGSPGLLLHYTTSQDFQARLNIFTAVMVFSVLLLKWIELRNIGMKSAARELSNSLHTLPKRKRLTILFFAAFIIYTLCAGILVLQKGLAFSGDEPYYLMTTDSLYEDRDINVADEYAGRDYYNFYPRELFPDLRLRPYARFGKKGTDYIYPISQPGVSALILPQYWLSRFFEGRTRIFIIKSSLALWGALLGLQLYLLALELWKNRYAALLVWFFFSFTAPILFFTIHIYPEIPIALFTVFIFRKARASQTPSVFNLLFSGFLLALFFWFGLKYNMIFYPLLAVCLYLYLKKHKLGWKTIYFLIFPVIAVGLFYLYVYSLYGTTNPISLYEGVLNPDILENFRTVMLKTPLTLRIDSFFDYFLDQRDGLLLYSPFYLFALLGLIEAFRRARKDLVMLLLIGLPFVLNYAFFAHRQGHSPQARVLSPLAWILALLVGYFLIYNRKNLFRCLFRTAGGASLVMAGFLLHHPSALYQPTTHQFTFRGGEIFISLSNMYFYLPDFLPSFLKINNLGWWPNYVWLAGILAFAAAYAVKKDFRPKVSFTAAAGGVVLLTLLAGFWLSFYPRPVLLSPARADFGGAFRAGIYGISRDAKMKQAGEIRLSRSPYTYRFFVTSWRPFPYIRFRFGSETGYYRIKLMYFDEVLYSGEIQYEIKNMVIVPKPSYPFKNANLYQFTVELQHLEGKTPPEAPFVFNFHPEQTVETSEVIVLGQPPGK